MTAKVREANVAASSCPAAASTGFAGQRQCAIALKIPGPLRGDRPPFKLLLLGPAMVGLGSASLYVQLPRAVRAVRLLLAHWRPLAVTDTRLAAVSRGHPHTRGRQSATYTVCVLGTSPPWWPMSSIGLVVRGCTHRSLPVVWRGAGTSAVLPRHAPVASPRRGWVGLGMPTKAATINP